MPHSIDLPNPAYKEIRSLQRGIELLRYMNQAPGGITTTSELSRMSQIPRPSVKRILETLRLCGLVRPTDRDGQYILTFEVRSLSEGFIEEEWIARVAAPLLRAYVKPLMWPCDLATMESEFMVIRESTHRFSMLSQHHSMIGTRLPVLDTAVGRAYLAACSEEQLENILKLLSMRKDEVGERARERKEIDRVLRSTREAGYSINRGEWSDEPDFSAIGLAVKSAGQLIGAINMVYPNASVDTHALEEKYLPVLKELAQRIGRDSAPWFAHPPEYAPLSTRSASAA
jgi:IclR family mhp operon transcriptional activator